MRLDIHQTLALRTPLDTQEFPAFLAIRCGRMSDMRIDRCTVHLSQTRTVISSFTIIRVLLPSPLAERGRHRVQSCPREDAGSPYDHIEGRFILLPAKSENPSCFTFSQTFGGVNLIPFQRLCSGVVTTMALICLFLMTYNFKHFSYVYHLFVTCSFKTICSNLFLIFNWEVYHFLIVRQQCLYSEYTFVEYIFAETHFIGIISPLLRLAILFS